MKKKKDIKDGVAILQGWQCPVCKKVHSPFTRNCDCHIKPQKLPTWKESADQ